METIVSDSRRFDMLKLWIFYQEKLTKRKRKRSLPNTIVIMRNVKLLGIERNMTHFYKNPNLGVLFYL